MRTLAIGLAVIALASACSTSDTTGNATTTSQATTTTQGAAAADPSPALGIAESTLGEIVVDADGATLYLFVPDAQGESTCYDQCEANWPPVVGTVQAGEGVDASLLGTTTRTDGAVQVTFNGWPLYHFGGDTAVGDTNGQGLNEVWWVVSPSGDAVGMAASSDGASSNFDY